MTANEDLPVSGEERFRKRRKSFFTYVGVAMLVALGAGIASGALAANVSLGNAPVWLFFAVWVIMLVAFVWFTRDYFRRVDELDLMDNLWASLAALYTYVVVYGSWYLFASLDIAPPINADVIFWTTMGAMLVAYGIRKLGWR